MESNKIRVSDKCHKMVNTLKAIAGKGTTQGGVLETLVEKEFERRGLKLPEEK